MSLFERITAVLRRALAPLLATALSLNLVALPVFQQVTSLNEAAASAIARYNADSGSLFDYVEVGRTVDEARGGVFYMRQFDNATGEEVPGIVEWLVLLPEGGGWRTLFPGDPGYTASFDLLPGSLMDRANDRAYREIGDPTITASLTLDDYQLPWEDAGWGTVTRSYQQHGQGKIDFDLTGSIVTAAKDGVIVYANDRYNISAYPESAWWYWNTVVIEHGPNEYSLYGHLAQGSIPEAIKSACAPPAAERCAVPVRAGDAIGAEGTTGYSVNPHLHLEVGQGYGVAAYPDVRDWDGDGDRGEPVYAGYVYAEHNVAFAGYTPDAVADWDWGRVEQAYHGESPSPGIQLVSNGGFDNGTAGWRASGQLNWSVENGVMRATRLNTSEPPDWAAFLQVLGVGAAAHTPFELSLSLGNASAIPKYVQVVLQSAAGQHYGAITCEFVVAANSPLAPYSLRGSTNATWAALQVYVGVNPPDSAPAALVDDVQVRRLMDAQQQTVCLGPDGAAATE